MTTGRPRTRSHKAQAARGFLRRAALLLALGLCGCAALAYLPPEKLPYAKLAVPYYRTQLKTSTSLDVLNVARDPNYQFRPEQVEAVLLTQSDTVIAYSGRSENGLKTWLDMVVFDEFRMTAQRKYFFCIDERAVKSPARSQRYLIPPRKGILFDSEFVIDPEITTTPYATDEAQKVAIINWLAGQFDSDVAALMGSPRNPTQGSELIPISGAMVRQMFQGILIELDKSPGLAAHLADERGIPFPHMSLDEGRLRMLVQNGVAAVTVRVNLPMTSKK